MNKNKEAINLATSGSNELTDQFENVKKVEFENGSIEYSLIGERNPDHNPIVIVSGMGNGRINVLKQAALLAEKAGTQVLIAEQPEYAEDVKASYKAKPGNALDFMATAYLAAAEDAGFTDEEEPVNMTGHSLGAPVAVRIRKIAKEKGLKSFDPENGSLLALLGAGASREKENLLSLGLRYPKYAAKGIKEASVLDPTGIGGKTVMGNSLGAPMKSLGEVRALSKASDRINYADLEGTIALVYPEDHMFPANEQALKGKGIVAEAIENEYPVRFMTPVDPKDISLNGLKKGKEAIKQHHRAGHDDAPNNPERTANVVSDFFNHPNQYL